MLADLLRFNREAGALAGARSPALETWTLGEYLDAHRYSTVVPRRVPAADGRGIWSCSTAQMLDFPLATFVRFCHNHGLLQVTNRPQWYTVAGGARHYVERIVATLDDVRLDTAASSVARAVVDGRAKVAVRTRAGSTLHDHVVLACHSDQSLALLDDASADEREHARRDPLPAQPRRAAHRRERPAARPRRVGGLELPARRDRGRAAAASACTT